MKKHKSKPAMQYHQPPDREILEAYLHKNAYKRADARRVKRALRKLAFS